MLKSFVHYRSKALRVLRRWWKHLKWRLPRRHTLVGYLGETLACWYLRRAGYEVWQRNWRCRAGEIDIIAFAAHQLIFVEVKTRVLRRASAFSPLDAIGVEKMAHLQRAAHFFLRDHRRALKIRRLHATRFDAVGVTLTLGLPARVRLELEHCPGGAEEGDVR